jgi:multiple sugar transport system permease protein/putative aldouronate transport system permease protein
MSAQEFHVRDKAFSTFLYVSIALFTLACLLPFWLMVIGSFTDDGLLRAQGFKLFPQRFSLRSYEVLFRSRKIYDSYLITLTVTSLGTCLAILITSSFSYVVANPKVRYRGILAFITFFILIFGSGMVGFYIVIGKWFRLKDTIGALIVPYLLNPFYALILVSFFRTFPFEISESATIDGANDIRIFFSVVVPIAKPAITTIALFYALQYWNDWWLAILFVDRPELQPLQIMLRQLLLKQNIQQYLSLGAEYLKGGLPTYGIQLATACVTVGPVILFYPFAQKYFIKGLTVGSLKG